MAGPIIASSLIQGGMSFLAINGPTRPGLPLTRFSVTHQLQLLCVSDQMLFLYVL